MFSQCNKTDLPLLAQSIYRYFIFWLKGIHFDSSYSTQKRKMKKIYKKAFIKFEYAFEISRFMNGGILWKLFTNGWAYGKFWPYFIAWLSEARGVGACNLNNFFLAWEKLNFNQWGNRFFPHIKMWHPRYVWRRITLTLNFSFFSLFSPLTKDCICLLQRKIISLFATSLLRKVCSFLRRLVSRPPFYFFQCVGFCLFKKKHAAVTKPPNDWFNAFLSQQ